MRRAGDVVGLVPPNDLPAERAVIGSILLENACFDEVTEELGEGDFYSEANGQIFEAMAGMLAGGAAVDTITLRTELVTHGKLSAVGGDEYLHLLTHPTPSVWNVAEYARSVHRCAVARRMILAAHEITARGYAGVADLREYIDWSEQRVFEAARSQVTAKRSEGAGDVAQRRYNELREHAEKDTTPGIKTGLHGLDTLLGGLHPGDLLLIAGRPGMGKSALAGTIARNIARTVGPVLWFSLEMKRELCVDRLLSAEASIDGSRIRNARLNREDWDRLAAAVAELGRLPIEIDDTSGISIQGMRSRARRVVAKHGRPLACAVVDYLQLATSDEEADNREGVVSSVSRGLKVFGGDFGIPVIALSQLNRDVERRQDKRPELSDLRESGAQEQDADAVAFVYRDEVYNPSTPLAGIAEIIVRKQRSGPTGTVNARFFGEYTRFDNLEDDRQLGFNAAYDVAGFRAGAAE